MKQADFIQKLRNAIAEKDVESAYKEMLLASIPDSIITSPYGTDGILENDKLSPKLLAILEFKYNHNFRIREEVSNVLIQVVYYFKKLEEKGIASLPSTIFVGDTDECFCLHASPLYDYLNYDIDWSIAPSEACKVNPELKYAISNNEKIEPFIFDINNDFKFKQVADKLLEYNSGKVSLSHITEHNINTVFHYFCKTIKTKMNTNEQVSLFMSVLTNYKENFIHPDNDSLLVTPNGNINVDGIQFKSFRGMFSTTFSPREKERLISICDRLIDDEKRRRDGAFFTPTEWVDEAHRMIEEAFGEDWKEKYIVWDCACGTGNLTRDYEFKELYASTLLQEELDIAIQNDINPEANRFQFDFLNDSFDKLPESLRKAIDEGKEIIFLINPPYGRATGEGGMVETVSTGVAETEVAVEMKKAKIGACSAQLYAQFMYRISTINKASLAIFSPSLYKTGSSYKKFRSYFYGKFQYIDGMLFNASHFSDTADSWGIDFSIWKQGKEERSELPVTVKDVDLNDGIKSLQQKSVYNLDKSQSLSSWIKRFRPQADNICNLHFRSALNFIEKDNGKQPDEFIGYLQSHANNVYKNSVDVSIMPHKSGVNKNGSFITKDNFMFIISIFTARKTIKSNWINQKDEYLVPNTDHPEYEQWNNDAIVYSLFNNSSNQSSLRDVMYKDKKHNIENEFFWMSSNEIKDLADNHYNDDLYKDAKIFGRKDRYVYKLLKTVTLSDDAQAVLDKATELVRKTVKYRRDLHKSNPEWHLNAWDASWYQVKLILKAYMKDELKEFNALYKKFEDRMREGVYKFGFLK
jgi:hypothetical protein